MAAFGVACIGGGEMFCLFGPIRYEHTVHLICHTIFYAGIGMLAIGAVMHYRERRHQPD